MPLLFNGSFNLKIYRLYCLLSQGNGQAKPINKVFGTLLTKLVNENWNDYRKTLENKQELKHSRFMKWNNRIN